MTWALWVGLGLVIAYEVYAALRHADDFPTISQWVWRTSVRYPVVPFLFGLLMGHFFL